MVNSGTIYAGRAISQLPGGRAVGSITASAGNGGLVPRRAAMCNPVQQCCCKGPWTIGPGETLPLILDWSQWLTSLPGYNLNKVVEMSLFDMTVNPPEPADPEEIVVVSGTGDDPEEPDNSDVADLAGLIPPYGVQAIVSVFSETEIGKQYRLGLAVAARDCDGRRIIQRDCVVIVVAEC